MLNRTLILTALLLLALALAGCPRPASDTTEQPVQTPTETVDAPAETDVGMPLLALELPSGATAVELPDELIADYPEADLSEDRSRMHVGFDTGMDYWFQAFTVASDDHEAILHYWDNALSRDGLKPLTEVNRETAATTGYFQGLWSNDDGTKALRIYNFDQAAAEAGENVPLVMLYQERGEANADGS